MNTKKNLLAKLNEKMLACQKCALRATCHQVVPGEGLAEAKIMLIGEGPGQKEDELGRPFVGQAGKFLDERKNIKIVRPVKTIASQPTLNKSETVKETPNDAVKPKRRTRAAK